MPKKPSKWIKVSVTIRRATLRKADREVARDKYRSRSHLFEVAVAALLE